MLGAQQLQSGTVCAVCSVIIYYYLLNIYSFGVLFVSLVSCQVCDGHDLCGVLSTNRVTRRRRRRKDVVVYDFKCK